MNEGKSADTVLQKGIEGEKECWALGMPRNAMQRKSGWYKDQQWEGVPGTII